MSFLKSLGIALSGVFRRNRVESDLDEELQFHLEMEIANNVSKGMTPREAERVARVSMGGVDQTKEASRDAWGLRFIAAGFRDLRLAFRSLARTPGFSTTAIITLGIGIGACAVMFSVINSVMLKPFAVRDQDRLVFFWENNPELGITSFSQSVPNFVDYRDRAKSFEALIGINTANVNLSGSDQRPDQAMAVSISAGFSKTFGWPMIMGREFTAEEDQPGGPKVVLLSEAMWRERYQADPNILSRTINLNREPHQVVGVISDTSNFFDDIDVWRPLAPNPAQVSRDDHWLTVIGRLAPGVSPAQAQAEADALAAGLREEHPREMSGWGAYLEPLYDELVPAELRKGLTILFCAVGLLLLIACSNVANLLLSQALAREHELAIRTALGASRWQIMRQLLAEAAVLSLGGTLLSLLVSSWGISLLRFHTPADALPRGEQIALDPAGIGFTVAVGILTVLAAGLIPALRLSHSDPNHAIGASTRAVGMSSRKSRLRSALVIVQVSLSLVLVVVAGLLLKSVQQLQKTDLGYDSDQTLVFQITPDQGAYDSAAKRLGFFDQIKSEIAALPGVNAIGISSGLPFSDGTTSLNVFTPDPSALPAEDSVQASWRIIDEAYFQTLQIPLVEGRTFNETDDGTVPAIIVSRALARRFWPDSTAIGKRFDPGGGGNLYEIIGIVEDIRLTDITGVSERPQMYFPLRHWTGWPTVSFAVRTEVDPATITGAVRDLIREIDAEQPVFNFNTLAALSAQATRAPQFQSRLLGMFAIIALTLAAIGIYAVMQTIVTQRTREIGVRMALGAQARETVMLLMYQGGRLVVSGILVGATLAWPLAHVLKEGLFETSPLDPLVLSIAIATIVFVAVVAIALPARRAIRINPIEALRGD